MQELALVQGPARALVQELEPVQEREMDCLPATDSEVANLPRYREDDPARVSGWAPAVGMETVCPS